LAAVIALLGFFFFCIADTAVKLLSTNIPVFRVTFLVTGVAFICTILWAVVRQRTSTLVPRWPSFALFRGGLLAVETLLIYFAFTVAPLTEVYVLTFLSPAFLALLAWIALGERLSFKMLGGLAVGFAGAVVIFRPGFASLNWGYLAAVTSAAIFAVVLLMGKRARNEDDELALVFVPLGVLTLLAGLLTAWVPSQIDLGIIDIALVCVGGSCLCVAHILIVRAVRIGRAGAVAPLQYSQIIWGSIFGQLVFGSPFELATFVGGALIVLSGWVAIKNS